MKKINVIKDFLVDLSAQQPADDELRICSEKLDPDNLMASAAADRLLSIKMWSACQDDPTEAAEDLRDIRKLHLDRLAKYRKRKEWQGWCDEDDLDMEGERLLAEIKNFKGEHMFSTRFY